jgi:hypothetical protein
MTLSSLMLTSLMQWWVLIYKCDVVHLLIIFIQISDRENTTGLQATTLQGVGSLQIPEDTFRNLVLAEGDVSVLSQALRNDVIIPDFQTFR